MKSLRKRIVLKNTLKNGRDRKMDDKENSHTHRHSHMLCLCLNEYVHVCVHVRDREQERKREKEIFQVSEEKNTREETIRRW